jgi:hypothetical protein
MCVLDKEVQKQEEDNFDRRLATVGLYKNTTRLLSLYRFRSSKIRISCF